MYMIINGYNTSGIPSCQLIDAGAVEGAAPRVAETATIYGANGKLSILDGAYDGYSRTLTFLVKSLADVQRLVETFRDEKNELEFEYQLGSLFYADFKSSRYKPYGLHYWTVDITLEMHPFRYMKDVEDVVLSSSGTVVNRGTVYSEPIIVLEGQGDVSLTIGKQTMRLTLDGKATIDCRHGEQVVLNKDGQIQNTIRKRGPFFEIATGRSGVTTSGNVSKVTIKGNWRYKV
ncbi:phage tail protein [Streptococcus acidominimus]|uniref:Phage protein n=1 Tax=Streptococcus acidominimus TaxID=1326 RepID=A0A1Q8EF70_STRAI|nr:phage tail protein [Streptococcus acidominimus]MBF0847230.1 phage tail protein [Streptococcus danieliae]MBF0818318.1 phage tail protein [Streptococcus acidominimus]MBF0838839.1 phage tail protein [Streptococcus acidominimus]MBF0839529.1 phage tail protein [Streptococcus acidominimus]OLF50424.1 phage tail protein [Streptococcus acidominimus]